MGGPAGRRRERGGAGRRELRAIYRSPHCLEYTDFSSDTKAPILTLAGRLRQLTVTGFFRPVPRMQSVYLDGSIDVIESEAGTSTSARTVASFQTSDIRLMPIRIQRDRLSGTAGITRSFLGLNTFVLPRQNLGAFMSRVTARTFVEMEGSGKMLSVSAYVARPVGEGFG